MLPVFYPFSDLKRIPGIGSLIGEGGLRCSYVLGVNVYLIKTFGKMQRWNNCQSRKSLLFPMREQNTSQSKGMCLQRL